VPPVRAKVPGPRMKPPTTDAPFNVAMTPPAADNVSFLAPPVNKKT